jgi:GR25 family glycosyltransferase involved in LPS biosynthesis
LTSQKVVNYLEHFSLFLGYDVMLKSTSIAGVAMKVYRKLFIKQNQIAIVPEGGYERNDKA